MSRFLYPVSILSQNVTLNFKEFTTKNHKDFVKVILNENSEIFQLFIDELIHELCVSDINVNILTNIDKLYILLCIRAYNISPELVLVTETDTPDKTKITIPLNINDILEAITDINLEYSFSVTDGIIVIKGSLPKQIFFDDIFDVVCDMIDQIEFKDQMVNLSNVSKEEKIEILNTLPSFVFPKVLELLQGQELKLKQNPVVKLNTSKKILANKEVFISLLNGSVAEIIKLVFNTDLREFYNNEYTLIRKFKFSYNHLSQITPAELGMYCDIISRDIEKEKKDAESREQRSSDQTIPMTPPAN